MELKTQVTSKHMEIHAEMQVKANLNPSLSRMRLKNGTPTARGGALGIWRFACYANPSCSHSLAQRLPDTLALQFYGEYHVKIIAQCLYWNKKQKII